MKIAVLVHLENCTYKFKWL